MHSTTPSTLGTLNFELLSTLLFNVENVQFDLKFSYLFQGYLYGILFFSNISNIFSYFECSLLLIRSTEES